MKLYIKQKVFSWTDRFGVKDEDGADRYFVNGELFSWGKKLVISDGAGNALGYIQQKVFSFKPKFYIYYGEEQIAEITREITFMKPKFTVSNFGWTVEGNFFAYNFDINKDGGHIASIDKELWSWGDSYVIDVPDLANEYVALAVVLAVDAIVHDSK